MATVKQLKKELDAKGIDYHKDDRKHELESLLVPPTTQPEAEDCCPEDCCPAPAAPEAPEAPEAPVERPRVIKAAAPVYIDPDADFIDPNADPATQAD